MNATKTRQPVCPACETPARAAYPHAHQWEAYPCGCVITADEATYLRHVIRLVSEPTP